MPVTDEVSLPHLRLLRSEVALSDGRAQALRVCM